VETAYERSLARGRRKIGGVFYTPPALAAYVVEEALGSLLRGEACEPVRIMDPACGAGALLVAAYRRLLAWHEAGGVVDAGLRREILLRSIFGIDVDAEAVSLAREALAQAAGIAVDLGENIRVGDAIRGEDARTFAVVVANPPYLDAEAMTRHDPELRAYCQGRFAAASGNWDLFCVFIERCLRFCRPGGRIGMIVPNKLLSADYARAARGLLVGRLRALRIYQTDRRFAADVYPIAFVAGSGADDVVVERVVGEEVVAREVVAAAVFAAPDRPWAARAGEAGRIVAHMRAAGRPLGELAAVRGAATVAEAYALAGLLREGGEGLRMINSGTIDPYEHLWGRKRLRYLGATYLRPVIPEESLHALPAKRLADARTPKVIVSGMTRTLEAVLDRDGSLMAGKSTTIVSSDALDLRYVVALLNSGVVRWYHRQVFGGDRLAGGFYKIGPPQVRRLPVAVPTNEQMARLVALVDGIGERPDAAAIRAIDAVVAEVFGLAADAVALIEAG
jgi:SAM-dependent methyltransferase